MTEQNSTPDDDRTMPVADLEQAMIDASDRWDGDEAAEDIIARFLAYYADLDRRITDARMASADGEVILFGWDDEQGTLVRVHTPTEEEVWDEVERARGLGYGEEHDQEHGLIHVLQHALIYGLRGEHVKSLGLVQSALNIMPTSKRVDQWPISIFIGREQAAANAILRAELAEQGKMLPPDEDDDTDGPSTEFIERLTALMADAEMPTTVTLAPGAIVIDGVAHPAKAASAHHGLADASAIADRIAAEQARDAEAE